MRSSSTRTQAGNEAALEDYVLSNAMHDAIEEQLTKHLPPDVDPSTGPRG